jgi:hypothetical protein
LDVSGQGFFTVNTAAMKAVVGFTGGKERTLGDVKIRLETPFASLLLIALEPGEDLAGDNRGAARRAGQAEHQRLQLRHARQKGPE